MDSHFTCLKHIILAPLIVVCNVKTHICNVCPIHKLLTHCGAPLLSTKDFITADTGVWTGSGVVLHSNICIRAEGRNKSPRLPHYNEKLYHCIIKSSSSSSSWSSYLCPDSPRMYPVVWPLTSGRALGVRKESSSAASESLNIFTSVSDICKTNLADWPEISKTKLQIQRINTYLTSLLEEIDKNIRVVL